MKAGFAGLWPKFGQLKDMQIGISALERNKRLCWSNLAKFPWEVCLVWICLQLAYSPTEFWKKKSDGQI